MIGGFGPTDDSKLIQTAQEMELSWLFLQDLSWQSLENLSEQRVHFVMYGEEGGEVMRNM